MTVSVELEFICGTPHIGIARVGFRQRRCQIATVAFGSLLRRCIATQSRYRNTRDVTRNRTIAAFHMVHTATFTTILRCD